MRVEAARQRIIDVKVLAKTGENVDTIFGFGRCVIGVTEESMSKPAIPVHDLPFHPKGRSNGYGLPER